MCTSLSVPTVCSATDDDDDDVDVGGGRSGGSKYCGIAGDTYTYSVKTAYSIASWVFAFSRKL